MSLEKVSNLSPDMAVTPGCWLVVDVPVPISSKQVLVMGTGNTSHLKVSNHNQDTKCPYVPNMVCCAGTLV